MKKGLQLVRSIKVSGGENKIINIQLKENFKKCTGVLLTAGTNTTRFNLLTVGLTVAQHEVLPIGTDAILIAHHNNISRDEAKYDFTEENIPARSSDVELQVKHIGKSTDPAQTFNVYFFLEND